MVTIGQGAGSDKEMMGSQPLPFLQIAAFGLVVVGGVGTHFFSRGFNVKNESSVMFNV